MTHFIEEMSKSERKEYRNNLRNDLIAAGGRIYTDEHNKTTVVIEPIVAGNNCKFFRVAVAYCNSSDKFRKSTGEAIALYRLFTNRYNVIRCETLENTNERMEVLANLFLFS